MSIKICRRCGKIKELSEYYRHAQMYDGHLNICKECTKKRVGSHREINIDRIRDYDRERGKLPHRKKQSLATCVRKNKEIKGYLSAHNASVRAVRKGILIKPKVCSWCNKEHKTIEGHHQDYSKKLFVTWLCLPCHRILHMGKSKKAEKMRSLIKIPEECKSTGSEP